MKMFFMIIFKLPRTFEAQPGISTFIDLKLGNPEATKQSMEAYMITKTGLLVQYLLVLILVHICLWLFLSEEGQNVLAVLLDEQKHFSKTMNDASSKYFAIAQAVSEDDNEASASFAAAAGRTNINHQQPGNFLSIVAALLSMPLSRGHVHIQSSDPLTARIINSKFPHHPLDLELLARRVKFTDTIANSKFLKSTVFKAGGERSEPSPGFHTLDQARDFVKRTAVSMWHASSTCSMLPRDMSSVVSPDLLVYGTEKLRVVDASVIPLIPRAHTQSTVYAVAERAVNIIRAQHGL